MQLIIPRIQWKARNSTLSYRVQLNLEIPVQMEAWRDPAITRTLQGQQQQ